MCWRADVRMCGRGAAKTGVGSLAEQARAAADEAERLEKEAARRRVMARELEERAKREQLQVRCVCVRACVCNHTLCLATKGGHFSTLHARVLYTCTDG